MGNGGDHYEDDAENDEGVGERVVLIEAKDDPDDVTSDTGDEK